MMKINCVNKLLFFFIFGCYFWPQCCFKTGKCFLFLQRLESSLGLPSPTGREVKTKAGRPKKSLLYEDYNKKTTPSKGKCVDTLKVGTDEEENTGISSADGWKRRCTQMQTIQNTSEVEIPPLWELWVDTVQERMTHLRRHFWSTSALVKCLLTGRNIWFA